MEVTLQGFDKEWHDILVTSMSKLFNDTISNRSCPKKKQQRWRKEDVEDLERPGPLHLKSGLLHSHNSSYGPRIDMYDMLGEEVNCPKPANDSDRRVQPSDLQLDKSLDHLARDANMLTACASFTEWGLQALTKQLINTIPKDGNKKFYTEIGPIMKAVDRAVSHFSYHAHRLKTNGIVTEKFRMVDVNALRNAIRKHQWGVSLDLKDAYLHVMVHKNSRKYLRFVINGVIYQYRTMPFGLNVAPRIFTILVGTIVKWAAGNGIQMITYLDDWLILHHNVDTLLTHAAQVIQKTLDLGWIINTKKSDLVPKNVFEFIGLEHYLLYAPQKRG